MRPAFVVAAAFILGSSVVAPHAQQNPRALGAGSGPATTVDFAAVDAKGQPVTDLTAADLAIRVDGKPREVRGLRLIKRDPPAPPGMPVSDPLPAPFASNVATGGNGRTVFLIFDNETIPAGREQRVRDGVLALLNMLGPSDEAAIVTVPHGGVTTDLTSDRAKLRAAAGQLVGAAPTSETADEAACRSRLTVQAITSVLARRAGSETPTEVVFVSSSLMGPRSNISAGATALGHGNVGGCELPNDEFTKLGQAASAARARFYIVQPEQIGMTTSTASLDSPLAGLENIASVTGGFLWHMAGSDEPGFQRIALETSSYYSATIEGDPADRGASSSQLSIKTSRPNVVIRTRPLLTFGQRPGEPNRGAAAPSPKDMLRTATVYRDTPLRLSAFAARNPGGKVIIMAVAEAANTNLKMSAASIGVYDAGGKLLSQWSANATELVAPALVTTFVQNPGQYRVRVAATDSAGRAGTADFDLNATLTPAAGVLTLSGMVIGTGGTGFTPKLQFSNEPEAIAYFELYGGKPGMPVSVVMELSTTLNGPATAVLQPKITASSTESDKYIIMTPIALGALPAGDYIVRAIVGLDGQPAGRIVRTLRKAQ